MEDSVKEAVDMVFVPGEDIWLDSLTPPKPVREDQTANKTRP